MDQKDKIQPENTDNQIVEEKKNNSKKVIFYPSIGNVGGRLVTKKIISEPEN
ncbi:MAG: hypothetical protein V1898_03510 [Patescibacteria group bacterium]